MKLLRTALLACLFASTAFAEAPRIDEISATPDSIVINITSDKPYTLSEAPTYGEQGSFIVLRNNIESPQVVLERFEKGVDRLYSKFVVVDLSTSVISDAKPKSVTNLTALYSHDPFEFLAPESIKGLQVQMVDDAITLGAKHAALNVNIPAIIDRGDSPAETWSVDGVDIGINMGTIAHFDNQIRTLTDAGMTVALILLNYVPSKPDPNNPFIHPKTNLAEAPNHLGAFNLTTREGFLHYRAATEFLAHRYTQPDRGYGWVQRYIVGNEVNSHWQWSNMGDIDEESFMRDYERAVRIADLAVRRYHPDARAFISLEHHWTIRYESETRATTGVRVLDLMETYSERGGDYPWAVAYHPYPENLFEPRFWNDATATLQFDTPRITFKNIEVLPAYLDQDRFRYEGSMREIILSEQGFHTPDGEDGETIQAAAYAYAYRKVEALRPAITSFILHRHVDHGHEGGLNLGLWSRDTNAPQPHIPLAKKKSWSVFCDADTDIWEEAFEFALPIIGIESWKAAEPRAVTP